MTIQLEDLSARHGKVETLSGITTPPIEAGEVVAVIGPNAAGKSTLFKRMAGLLKGSGAVRLGEGVGAVAESVRYMPQDNQTTAILTVYESIILARKQGGSHRVSEADLAVVDATIAELDLAPIAHRIIGDLSGGQRQVVSLAQTLARDPRILLLDEPTSALDLHRQVDVLSLVRRLTKQRGMITFIALHDLNHALRFADRAMVIAGGTLQAEGPVEAVITPALLRRIYQVDARIEPCSRGVSHVIVDGVAHV